MDKENSEIEFKSIARCTRENVPHLVPKYCFEDDDEAIGTLGFTMVDSSHHRGSATPEMQALQGLSMILAQETEEMGGKFSAIPPPQMVDLVDEKGILEATTTPPTPPNHQVPVEENTPMHPRDRRRACRHGRRQSRSHSRSPRSITQRNTDPRRRRCHSHERRQNPPLEAPPGDLRHCQVGSLAFGGSWSQTLAVLAGNRHGWARHWPQTGAILVFEGRRGASRLMQSPLITANSVSLVPYYFSKSFLNGSLPNST